jgi:hypothetical protein
MTETLIELIIISVLSVILILVSSVLVLDKMKYRKLLQTSVQLVLDKSAMSDEIDRLSFLANNSDELNDGFVKFLSESRDMAFEYISEVQSAIERLKNSMDLGNEDSISQSYQELISFLPAENHDVVD